MGEAANRALKRAALVQGCGPTRSNTSVGQIPDVGWIVCKKPLPMKASALTKKIKAQSQEGLAFHEILSDELEHVSMF